MLFMVSCFPLTHILGFSRITVYDELSIHHVCLTFLIQYV